MACFFFNTLLQALDFDSLAKMAEQVEGSFPFAVLDEQDALWIVKGDSLLSIAYFPECGVYVYASTAEILNRSHASSGFFRIFKGFKIF